MAPPALTFAELQAEARARHLTITAALTQAMCQMRDDLPPGTQSLMLLSPDEPAFWPAFAASPEYRDHAADPMDRWSQRVIGTWATQIGATPLFPFGGPPFQPFIQWALTSGFAHSSPVGMMVHAHAGLYLSFRGALALPYAVACPSPPPAPCERCESRPCLTACPVQALTPQGYATDICRSYLRESKGNDCMAQGCRARRACPRGQSHGRLDVHAAYHMSQFI